ncbi:hypothetical protein D3C87_2088730 [compost metagenome]
MRGAPRFLVWPEGVDAAVIRIDAGEAHLRQFTGVFRVDSEVAVAFRLVYQAGWKDVTSLEQG